MAQNQLEGMQPDTADTEPSQVSSHDSASSTTSEPRTGNQTKSILQDAIQKVMAEIERHEAEAKKHLQKAAELRKELRESIAFLQEQGDKGQRSPAAREAASSRKVHGKERITGRTPAGRKSAKTK